MSAPLTEAEQEITMVTRKRLISACALAFTALAAATVAASADIGRDDGASKAESIGTMVALNPQPLPPRCLPLGCRGGGGNGPAKFRSVSRRA
jgi:hypothetical protein